MNIYQNFQKIDSTMQFIYPCIITKRSPQMFFIRFAGSTRLYVVVCISLPCVCKTTFKLILSKPFYFVFILFSIRIVTSYKAFRFFKLTLLYNLIIRNGKCKYYFVTKLYFIDLKLFLRSNCYNENIKDCISFIWHWIIK